MPGGVCPSQAGCYPDGDMGMRLRSLVLVFLVVLGAMAPTTRAATICGTGSIFPAGQHPRLLLDSNRMAQLRARVSANTPQWQALKSLLDSNLTSNVFSEFKLVLGAESLLSKLAGIRPGDRCDFLGYWTRRGPGRDQVARSCCPD